MLPKQKVNTTMSSIDVKNLLDAGVHFGHLTRSGIPTWLRISSWSATAFTSSTSTRRLPRWGRREGLRRIASQGKKILFVATKKQAKEIVADYAGKMNMPYMAERWPGGMLTNFVTIRKAVKKMGYIDKKQMAPSIRCPRESVCR